MGHSTKSCKIKYKKATAPRYVARNVVINLNSTVGPPNYDTPVSALSTVCLSYLLKDIVEYIFRTASEDPIRTLFGKSSKCLCESDPNKII